MGAVAMNRLTSSPSKSSPKSRDLGPGPGLWTVMEVVRFCSMLAAASVLISVIMAHGGGLDAFLICLAASAVIIAVFGSIALAMVALGWAVDALRWAVQRSNHDPRRGGVFDDWLDGPA